MPLQLIFTSAPQGLTPGRSGYCTVARHRAVPDRLAQLLESLGTPHGLAGDATFTFRALEAAGRSWFVLSRFVARGLDYTQRDNRLAHHLIFSAEEAALLPPPAALAARWSGWQDEWAGAPAWLEGEDKPLRLGAYAPLSPATRWRELAGTGAKAAWLVNASGAAKVSLLNPPDTETVLRLFAESSALIGKAAWAAGFTTDARVTGGEGFLWSAHDGDGTALIDLALAADLPAPSGDLARQAAVGVAAARPAAAGASPAAPPKASGSAGVLVWIVGGALLLGAGAATIFLARPSTPEPAPAPVVVARPAPTPEETAQTDEILRANRALTEIQGLLEADDVLAAARLWSETSARSPRFVANYREQVLPRLLREFSASAVRAFSRRLDRPGITDAPRACQAIRTEAEEALRLGAELKVPADQAWTLLGQLAERAGRLQTIDVRPVILVPGEWRGGSAGRDQPSQAEFALSRKAVDTLRTVVDAAGSTKNNSIAVRLRLLALASPHVRDEATPFLAGEIRRSSQTIWIESTPEPGRSPAIAISLGGRRDVVALNFRDAEGLRADANRLLEISLPQGRRQCLALLGDVRSLQALDLGPGSLVLDADTGVIRAAAWAEPAVNAFVWAPGLVGLYPDGHEFPDSDLPSPRATRSLLETDLNRLERRQGPDAPSYESIDARRKLFQAGRLLEAGAPWTLRAVDADGKAGPALLELR